ncbi:MAG: hypothetical protein HY898_10530 [Deltaproteobacteria bacterium]|nr:hypothetical protein [Deltaproteobacteria bacterium]
MQPVNLLVGLGVAALWAGAVGCGYDFDAPFTEPWKPGVDASDGALDVTQETKTDASGGKGGSAGKGGTGGAAGTGGASGQGGTAGQGGAAAQGGSAGQGGASGTGGIAGGGAGGGGLEDCTNGVDDNGDGHIDCADSACTAGYTCVPAAPAGLWSQTGFHRSHAGGDPSIDCGPGFTTTTFHAGIQPTVGDSCACTCEPPTGGSCGDSVRHYSVKDCAGASKPVSQGICEPAENSAAESYDGNLQLVSTGNCASTAVASFAQPTWMIAHEFCRPALQGGGCPDGNECVPKPDASYSWNACVEQSGDAACPTAFGSKFTVHAAYADTRACNPAGCGCGTPSGVSCIGTLGQYADGACSVATGPAQPVDGQCHALNAAAFLSLSASTQGGACSSDGSATKMGSVVASEPHTLCCQP